MPRQYKSRAKTGKRRGPGRAKGTGEIIHRNGRVYVRIAVFGQRPMLGLPEGTEDRGAHEWADAISAVIDAFRGHRYQHRCQEFLETAVKGTPLDMVATAQAFLAIPAEQLAVIEREELTIRAIGESWTSGKLAKEHPVHVAIKKRGEHDAGFLKRYVYPACGHIKASEFALEHAQAVANKLPERLSVKSKRNILGLLVRLLNLAVFPIRAITASPLPRNWLPKVPKGKAKTYLFPSEEAQLIGCKAIPLVTRMAYAFLAREGMRASEAKALRWSDLDLDNGTVSLDVNKTDDPRSWVLGPDVVLALRAWRTMTNDIVSDKVFAGVDLRADRTGREKGESGLRIHLKLAGIERAQLFERTAKRIPVRVHDLRSSFVTVALADGRGSDYVCDRTGHASTAMVNTYRRAARSAAELRLGWFAPMHRAIPEVAAVIAKLPKGQQNPPAKGVPMRQEVPPNDSAHLPRNQRGRKGDTRIGGSDGPRKPAKLQQNPPLLPLSGRVDSNHRPSDPQSDALTRLRYAPRRVDPSRTGQHCKPISKTST